MTNRGPILAWQARTVVAGSDAPTRPVTQLMWAVSWHDMAEVSSPGGGVRIPSRRAESGRHPADFVDELRSAKCGWLTESRSARIPTSRSRHRAGLAGEQRFALAGRALAELKVAGPHAAPRQVVVGVRAGGLLEVHAARRLALVASRCAKARRTESRSLSSRPSRAVIESESRGAAQGLLERKASWAATCRRCAARGWRAGLGWRRRCESSLAAGPA